MSWLGNEFGFAVDAEDFDAACFDDFFGAFLAVDEDEDKGDFAAFGFDGVHSFDGGTAGGGGVFNEDDGVAGLEVAFDALAGAVFFGFLADGEHLEGRPLAGGFHGDGEGDGVGAHGHASDGDGFLGELRDFFGNGGVADFADEDGSAAIHGADAAVDVKIALFAGGEGEITGADGFFLKDGFELVACCHGPSEAGDLRLRHQNFWRD